MDAIVKQFDRRLIIDRVNVFSGLHHPSIAPECALTIGNLDGVHRGHQALLALLRSEALHRGLPSCVLTFEPHPRTYFAQHRGVSEKAPERISTLRDKLTELKRCGVDQVVVMRFDAALANLTAADFVRMVLLEGLHARYLLVGDDFRFGIRRTGDYLLMDREGERLGFDVARMNSYEVHGTRVSSSAVRAALHAGDMKAAEVLLGRPYSISGHVVHGRKLGRLLGASRLGATDGYRTLNIRFTHAQPAASGIFAVRVHGLVAQPIGGVASLGVRPTVDDAGRVLLEVHCPQWPASLSAEEGYGKILQVDLLHKLRAEMRYNNLPDLTEAIGRDVEIAAAWLSANPASVKARLT